MYRAKARGKACYEMFDKAMRERAMARLQLETDLRKALDRDELRLHYQLIVSLETGKIAGFEALVRWQHPVAGLFNAGRVYLGCRGNRTDHSDRTLGPA